MRDPRRPGHPRRPRRPPHPQDGRMRGRVVRLFRAWTQEPARWEPRAEPGRGCPYAFHKTVCAQCGLCQCWQHPGHGYGVGVRASEFRARSDAREAEGSGLLSRPVSDGRAGSNPAPTAYFNPPYRYEMSTHGPVTIYDAVDVGWVARVKETLPHKEKLAKAMVAGLNAHATGLPGIYDFSEDET